MNKIQMVGAFALAGVMIAGCGKDEKKKAAPSAADKGTAPVAAVSAAPSAVDPDQLVLAVNGAKLTRGELDADVAKILAFQGDKIPADRREEAVKSIERQIVQGFLIERALVDEAKKGGYAVTAADRTEREAEFVKQMAGRPDAPKSLADFAEKFPLGKDRAMEEFENGILIDKMIKAESAKAAKKDYAAEAKKIIDGIVSNNNSVASTDAAALKKIKGFQEKLAKSTNVTNDFAELAKANSACPSSARGGDLGEFGHGQMVKEFDEAAFKLPVGKVSEPVKTQFGYHLILVTGKTPAVGSNGVEKVRASHILVKTAQTQQVPKLDELVKNLQRRDEGMFARQKVQEIVQNAQIEACEEYKMMIPPKKDPKAAAPVEPAAEK